MRSTRILTLGLFLIIIGMIGCTDKVFLIPDTNDMFTQVNPRVTGKDAKDEDKILEPDFHFISDDGRTEAYALTVTTNFAAARSATIDADGRQLPLDFSSVPKSANITATSAVSPFDRIDQYFQNAELVKTLTGATPKIQMWSDEVVSSSSPMKFRWILFFPKSLLPVYPKTALVTMSVPSTTKDKDGNPEILTQRFQVTRGGVFNILALGDSVVWGEGNNESDKFTSKVATEILNRTGTGIRVYRYAHSGATGGFQLPDPMSQVGPNPHFVSLDKCDQETLKLTPFQPASSSLGRYDFTDLPNSIYFGEVGKGDGFQEVHRDMSVVCQLQSFKDRVDSPSVDLVLLDGCANDVNISDIPGWFGKSNWKPEFITAVKTQCHDMMVKRIKEVATLKPSKGIMVTGYYPMVSGTPAVLTFPDEMEIGTLKKTAADWMGLREFTGEYSATWFLQSNTQLQAAVNETNSTLPGGTKVVFAGFRSQDWDPDFSMTRSKSHIWDWVKNAGGGPDPLMTPRGDFCKKVRTDGECLVASFAHPNAKGHELYTSRIMTVMPPDFLPSTKGALGDQCLTQPVNVCVESNKDEAKNCVVQRFHQLSKKDGC